METTTDRNRTREPRALETSRRPRVIVAEDDPDLRMMISVALRGLGYDIVEARNGAELLDRLGDALIDGDASARPDVIVSDIRMPGLTGMEILTGLRQADWQTPIVLMTAYADREMREEARRFGVDAFFDKPFDIDDLATAVVNMTRTRPHTAPVRRHPCDGT